MRKTRTPLTIISLFVLIAHTFCVKVDLAPIVTGEEESVVYNLPTVITDSVVIIRTPKEVMMGFRITNDGGATIIVKGLCWSTSHNPTINDHKLEDGGQSLTVSHCHIGLLEKNTTYYVRAYAKNIAGIAYGNEVSFTTPASFDPIIFNPGLTYGSVSDSDGNIYKTIQIGTQTWMAENLKTTKYSDGSPILLGTGGPAGYTTWFSLGAAYCWYDNDSSTYKDAYGALYNWQAVVTGKLCPTGWHVPSYSDWTTLVTLLGGKVEPFNEKTENAMIHWESTNNNINESGFTPVFPAGELCGWGFLQSDLWWSSTPRPRYGAAYLITFRIISFEPMSYGYPVRCLKD